MVFLVIVGTVAVYGLTISPLARYLGLAQPNPQGVLFLGAHPWAQQIARTLHDLGFKVLIIDSNAKNIEQAQRNGVPARRANALSDAVVDELDLGGIGRFLALTPNDEVNSLAALIFSEIFESGEVYQLAARPESLSDGEGELPRHLRGRPLFDERANYLSLSSRFDEGGEVKTFDLTEEFTYEKLQRHYDHEAIPLFLRRGQDELLVFSQEDEPVTQPGDTLVVFMPPLPRALEPRDQASFEQLVERALFVELSEKTSFEDIVRQASALFAHRLPIAADRLAKGFLEGSRYGATPVSHGVALPHYQLASITQPEMVMVRCQSGVSIAF
ncbi:MAG: NAD-binding protein, partial [Rhodothermales bacterium]